MAGDKNRSGKCRQRSASKSNDLTSVNSLTVKPLLKQDGISVEHLINSKNVILTCIYFSD